MDLFETFVHYHLSMGFDHIYIYDHDGSANTDFVRELVSLDKVTYVYGVDQVTALYRKKVEMQISKSGGACQAVETNHCLIQNRAETDFLFFVKGFDKFVTSAHGPDTLKTFLETYYPLRHQLGLLQSGAQRMVGGIDYNIDKGQTDEEELPVFLTQRTPLAVYDKWWFG